MPLRPIDKNGNELNAQQFFQKVAMRLYSILLEFTVFILHVVGHIPSHWVRKVFYWLAGIRIAANSTIHMGARFYEPFNIVIGSDTIIGEGAVLDGRDKLMIGDHVDIASEVMIYNSHHDINDGDFKAVMGPVTIGDYVFIGPRAIILPNVTIGKGAVVAAGAVVTKSVAEFEIVGGVPAVKIGERKNKDLHYKLGRARLFR